MLLEKPSRKDGILSATTLFNEHGLDVICLSLEQQVAQKNYNVAYVGGIETTPELKQLPN
jgi:hypothetical protein